MKHHHVLLVAYGGGHITMVVPVMRELERRGVRCTLMALTTGYNKAVQMGLQPKGYRDFRHLLDSAEAVMAWGDKLAAANSHPEVDELETRLYMGVNYVELVQEHGEARAAEIYAEKGRYAFLPRAFMSRVLADLRPDAVVTTNTPRTEQASIEAAVRMGIPVLGMIDLFGLSYDPFVHRSIQPDRVAVIADFVKSNLVAAGIEASRVVVTGNPAFDSLMAAESRQRAEALRRNLGWQDKKIIMLAGQLEQLPDTPAHWVGTGLVLEAEAILRAHVDVHEDRALIVRYHPNEFQAFPDLGRHPRVYKSPPGKEALHPVLLACDAVVVQTSTVGLEAVLAGRQLLSLSYSPAVTPDRWDYGALGLATVVPLPGQLAGLVEQCLGKPGAMAGQFHVGHAAANVANAVLQLLGGRPNGER